MRRLIIVCCIISVGSVGCSKLKRAIDSTHSKSSEHVTTKGGEVSGAPDAVESVTASTIRSFPSEVTEPAPRIPDGGNVPPPSVEERVFADPKNQFVNADEVSGSEIKKLCDEYLEERSWELGISPSNPGSAYIGWGVGMINVPPDDIRFGIARILAFEKAFQEAKGEFARVKARFTTTSTIRRVFDDDREFDPRAVVDEGSRAKVIKEKVLALTEAKLDSALSEAGVDPGEFAGRTPSQKRQILEDSISREIKVKAIQSVAGMRVQTTFEDLHSVGVLVVFSERMRAVASGVARGCTVGGGGKTDPKASILEQINQAYGDDDTGLIFVHGVRVLIDDNGDRALVAFGQSSPKILATDSTLKKNVAFQAARAIAQDMADGALTDFVNSSVVLESKALVQEYDEVNRIVQRDFEEDQESISIGQEIDRLIKTRGHTNLSGVITLKQWTANHPETGHLIFGHILMWSPASQAAARGKWTTKKRSTGGQPGRAPENKAHQSLEFEDDF